MLDHVGGNVTSLAASRAFYEAALAPLAVSVQKEVPGHAVGLGADGFPWLWLAERAPVGTAAHIAIRARSHAAVDAFHAAALAAGGADNGAPGLRPQYHPGYYGAFVLDPDGNNLEAVCHREG